MPIRFVGLLVSFLLIAAACTSTDPSQAELTTATQSTDEAEAAREQIVVPLTLYRLVDTNADGLGTQRTTEEVTAIGAAVSDIWAQADIVFEPLHVRDIEVTAELLAPIVASGEIGPLLDSFQAGVDVPDPGDLNGFFLSAAFGVNGFAPSGTRTFFVVDAPTVPDERVTSHEIGHLLGLHHDLVEPGNLMFSGTDGITLTPDEQTVARYVAQGVLREQR